MIFFSPVFVFFRYIS